MTRIIRDELRSQGKLSADSHTSSVLVERNLSNPKLASSYVAGDQIHYKTGSAETHGIANNSLATVVSTDSEKNLLTIETRNGERAVYNPAQLKRLTAESKVYREESRDLAEGDRVQLIRSDWKAGIRGGTLGSIEKLNDEGGLSIKSDNGKLLQLDSQQARHVDYGYAVESVTNLSADRVILSGDGQIMQQREALRGGATRLQELSVYTSQAAAPSKIPASPQLEKAGSSASEGIGKAASAVSSVIEGFGIGM